MSAAGGTCFFASDLHGRPGRYARLLALMAEERPRAVFLGGDLLPHPLDGTWRGEDRGEDFVSDYLVPGFAELRARLGTDYPDVFLILGNDDARCEEAGIVAAAERGLWRYAHGRRLELQELSIYGYAYVPPSPFQLKDWERYDVSRYVDPGCVSPEEGSRSQPRPVAEIRYASIAKDLEALAGEDDLSRAIFLFHAPPYKTLLDRAALDGQQFDHVPLDPHIGSIAIQRFIEVRQPLLTLHGHVHESTRLSGAWRDRIGSSHAFQGAHDGEELALIRFDPDALAAATRNLY